jgi:hypothetical protein
MIRLHTLPCCRVGESTRGAPAYFRVAWHITLPTATHHVASRGARGLLSLGRLFADVLRHAAVLPCWRVHQGGTGESTRGARP